MFSRSGSSSQRSLTRARARVSASVKRRVRPASGCAHSLNCSGNMPTHVFTSSRSTPRNRATSEIVRIIALSQLVELDLSPGRFRQPTAPPGSASYKLRSGLSPLCWKRKAGRSGKRDGEAESGTGPILLNWAAPPTSERSSPGRGILISAHPSWATRGTIGRL